MLVQDCKAHWATILRNHYLCLAALQHNNHDQAFLHMAEYISDMNSVRHHLLTCDVDLQPG